MVDRFAQDWRSAGLDEMTVALLSYAEKLTADPAVCGRQDVDLLRQAGWDDEGVTSAIQVIAYFNYINRIAEGLGATREDWIDDSGRETGAR